MGMNMNKMMKEMQSMQNKLVKIQEELGNEVLDATAGGGAVKVTIDGHLNVRSIEIAAEVVDPEDTEMLQDLVLTAVNEAIAKAQDLANKRMGSLTGGMKIPGLM